MSNELETQGGGDDNMDSHMESSDNGSFAEKSKTPDASDELVNGKTDQFMNELEQGDEVAISEEKIEDVPALHAGEEREPASVRDALPTFNGTDPPSTEVEPVSTDENSESIETETEEAMTTDTASAEIDAASEMKTDLDIITEQIAQGFHNIGASISGLRDQLSYIPPQVRLVQKSVSDMTISISEGRLRSLLLEMAHIYDLVEQFRLSCENMKPVEQQALNSYEILGTQIKQILKVNGFTEIPRTGLFDPELHFAMVKIPCDCEEKNNTIHSVIRAGFRSKNSILRCAEVKVNCYTPGSTRVNDIESPNISENPDQSCDN